MRLAYFNFHYASSKKYFNIALNYILQFMFYPEFSVAACAARREQKGKKQGKTFSTHLRPCFIIMKEKHLVIKVSLAQVFENKENFFIKKEATTDVGVGCEWCLA